MTWVQIDDGMPEHPKILRLSDRAFRLQVEGLCYSNRNLTDGFVPSQVAHRSGRKSALELVAAGCWDEADGGYQIHDFDEYQPSRAEVLKRREQTAGRVREWRRRKRGGNPQGDAEGNAAGNGVTPALVTLPPVPSPSHNPLEVLSPSLQGRSTHDLTIEINDKTISPSVAASIERLTERLTDRDPGTLGRLVKLAKAGASQADFEDARAALGEITPASPSRYACHIVQKRLTDRQATA